jgi:hypothetical protein
MARDSCSQIGNCMENSMESTSQGAFIIMRKQVITAVMGLGFIILGGCRNTPPLMPMPRTAQASAAPAKAEVGESARKAAKDYSVCVWSNAEKMRLGSTDVRLVVDTAESTCKKRAQRLQLALAADKTGPAFARSYMDTIVENARTEATALVLRGNAKDARNREGNLLRE